MVVQLLAAEARKYDRALPNVEEGPSDLLPDMKAWHILCSAECGPELHSTMPSFGSSLRREDAG